MSSYRSPEEECFPSPTGCYSTTLSYSQSSSTHFSLDNAASNASSGYCSSSSSHSTPNNAPITPEPENTNASASTSSVLVKAAKAKKTYPCSCCSKFFSRPSALETHMYTHTLEKPFQCRSPECGRRFSVVSNLRRHFKVHQKPSGGNKITPQDRLRYVRQLIQKNERYSALSEESQESKISADQYQPSLVCGKDLVSQQQETIPSLSLPPPRPILPPIASRNSSSATNNATVYSDNTSPAAFDNSNSFVQANQQNIDIASGENQVDDNFLFGYDLSFNCWTNQVNNTGEARFTENQESNIVGTTTPTTTFTTFEDFNFFSNNNHQP